VSERRRRQLDAETVDVEAKTRVRERFIVAAPVGGRLLRLPWHEGDRLTAGTIVARIDALPSTSAVSEALAQLQELRHQQAGVETRPKPEAIDQARWHVASALAAERAARDRVISGIQAYDQAVRDTRRAMALAARGYLPAAQLEAAQLAEKTRAQELRIARNDATAATAEVRTARAALAETEAKRSDPDYLLRVYGARMAAIEAQLATLEVSARERRCTLRSAVPC
jgi:HlyD family secretion protein